MKTNWFKKTHKLYVDSEGFHFSQLEMHLNRIILPLYPFIYKLKKYNNIIPTKLIEILMYEE